MSFLKSQAKIKDGVYTLERIELSKIDVVFKGIATRHFFNWDKNIDNYINGIKKNFQDMPPVILEELDGKYYSVDGHHRITAALELGLNNILSFTIKVNQLTHTRK